MLTRIKVSRRKILLLIMMITSLIVPGYSARVIADPPLTKGQIIEHWESNPGQDVQAYIEYTVRKRKVGFLPTIGIRRELCDNGVPKEVVDALKKNFHEIEKFKFQVWKFDSEPNVLADSKINQLAHNIIQQLMNQTGELLSIFTHYKPPVPEPCVSSNGNDSCPDSGGPRLFVKGNVERAGSRLKAIVRVSYVSPSGTMPIGREYRTTIISNQTEQGLMNAAAEIVKKINQSLIEEMTDQPFTCQ